MNGHYYLILYASYAVAISIAALFYRTFHHQLYLDDKVTSTPHPWREVLYVLLATISTLIVGRLYSGGYLLSDFNLGHLKAGESVNQVIVFSPFIAYILIRRKTLSDAWLPPFRLPHRIAIGFCISIVSVVLFSLLAGQRPILIVVGDVFHIKNMHHIIQVFMEDLAICLLLSGLSMAMGRRFFLLVAAAVSLLFALGHLPAQFEAGISTSRAFLGAAGDSLLTFSICFSLYRSKDFAWFWPIHFAMDMMQFFSGIQP